MVRSKSLRLGRAGSLSAALPRTSSHQPPKGWWLKSWHQLSIIHHGKKLTPEQRFSTEGVHIIDKYFVLDENLTFDTVLRVTPSL